MEYCGECLNTPRMSMLDFGDGGQSYHNLQTNTQGEHSFTYPPLRVNFLLHLGMRHLKKSDEAKQIRHNCQDIGKELKGN